MKTQVVALGDVSETIMGQAPPGANCNKERRGTVFVKAGEFSDLEPVIREWTTTPLKLAKKGDVLVCVVGATAGKINLGIDCAIGRSVAAVRPRSTRLDTAYLHQFLRTRTDQLRSASQGLAQGVITREMLSKLEVPLPPLAEQRRIAAILDRADTLRRKRQRSLGLVREMASALAHKYLIGEEIELGDAIIEGPTNGLYKPSKDYGDGVPILRIDSFYDGRIVDIRSLKRLRASPAEIARFQLRVGDIVVNRVNSLEYLGKSALIRQLLEPTVFESNMMRLSLDSSLLLPEVCIALLQTSNVKKQVLSKAKNAVNQSSINQGDVRSLRIPLPKMDQQRRFLRGIEGLESIAERMIEGASQSVSLFSSLQHRAFSGQL